MESQVSEERMKLEQHLAKVCDKNGSREEARKCITNRLNQICSHFLPHFVRADTLAQKYQGIYTLSSKLIYLLAAVMVTAVSAGAVFKVQETAITLFEIAAIAFILFLIYYGNRIGWRKRWQDNRLLSERLRHAVFLAMADQPACSDAPEIHSIVNRIVTMLPIGRSPKYGRTGASSPGRVCARTINSR